jgi:hypothetical protein
MPVIGTSFSIYRAKGALYTASRVELRSHWWRVFIECGRFKKSAAFIGWLHGVQRMRVDERSDQGYRHPPYGVLESKVTKEEENGLKRTNILAELRLRPKAIFVVRPWILEADDK